MKGITFSKHDGDLVVTGAGSYYAVVSREYDGRWIMYNHYKHSNYYDDSDRASRTCTSFLSAVRLAVDWVRPMWIC